ncbi:MAG TPA: hypothetical protein VGD81_04940 [Opitutaceae bacterium]
MNTTTPINVTASAATTEDKTAAIVSYLTLIGFIIAVVLHCQKKTRLGAFHLRQSLGLMAVAVGASIALSIVSVIPFVGWLVGLAGWAVLWIGGLVLWIMGLIAAANGECKPVPVLGEQFQKWFGQAFE